MTQVVEPEAQRYVGQGLRRKEDPALLTGQGRYVDDLVLPGMVWMAVVRSPVAHARIRSIDTAAARQAPGVLAVYTADDLADQWAAGLPCVWPIASRTMPAEPTGDPRLPDHHPLAKEKVRFMGEPVAVVVVDTRELAADAVELVDVDYDELPAVVDLEAALAPDAPVVHDALGSNDAFVWKLANGEVDKVFAEAPVVVKQRYVHPRLIANAIEPRGVVVQPTPAAGEYTVWSATQIPHILKVQLAVTLGIPESKLRVIAPQVGGGFGSKLDVYAEEALAVAAARKLGLPVKWIEERSENYLATVHGRAQVQDLEVAATEDGKLLGVRADVTADMGAYLQLLTPGIPLLGSWLFHGVYDAQAYSFTCTGVFTNRTPTDAYRGARPARGGLRDRTDHGRPGPPGRQGPPAELRRLNFIPKFTEARAVIGGLQFDSGDYEPALDKAMALVGYDELRKEQQASGGRRNGRLLGVGISTYIELCGWAPSQTLGALKYAAGGWDAATIRCHPTGKVTVITGTSPHGQGHETSWSQIAADALGVSPDDVEVLHGDTAIAPLGLDTYGSRSVAVGGTALYKAAERIRAKARTIAAHELEVAEDDLEWVAGRFRVRGAPDKAKTIAEVASSAWTAHGLPAEVEPGLEATAVFDPPNLTFPFGAHICVVEVDPETGATHVTRYVAVDDCGTIINPLIVEGQLHGGIAQGIAEALYEEALYDDNGTLLTGNMSTYRIPSAAELPSFELAETVTPSSANPLGVKGIGEAGTIGSPPAVLNAVADALRFAGAGFIDKPATPERVWRAIHAGDAGQARPGAKEGGQA